MESFTDILEYLKKQDYETKLKYYDRLGFNLTIAIRSIWSNPATSDKEKIVGIKTINELSHRIFNWKWRIKKATQHLTTRLVFWTSHHTHDKTKMQPEK